eukprot:TRINITY_DN1866_c0_g1_i1.p1 TRINITY_DN1866_c0_g1~~TRINITY_DN1866_c0_g1_i1.p1  ORF type:complete len:261 (+),score=54.09 TRINITY_DN1866_c0_g1_i1:287-1069(+)
MNNEMDLEKDVSILKAIDILQWQKINIIPKPKIAIISSQSIRFIQGLNPMNKVNGLGAEVIRVNRSKSIYFCSKWGIGAPALISLCEKLAALGIQKILLFGFSGRLIPEIQEGQVFHVNKAISYNGTSCFYSKNEELSDSWKDLKLIENINLPKAKIASTDCPFRETPSLINEMKSKHCSLVDMETSALYAFADYYGLEAISISVASDNLTNMIWRPPVNFKNLQENTKKNNCRSLKILSAHVLCVDTGRSSETAKAHRG